MRGWIAVHKGHRGIYFEKENIFCVILEEVHPVFLITTVHISSRTLHSEVDIPDDIHEYVLQHEKLDIVLDILQNAGGRGKKVVLTRDVEHSIKNVVSNAIASEKEVAKRIGKIIADTGGGLH
jgi:hypothetical protein